MKKLLLIALTLLPLAGIAQDDAGLWTSIGVEKKLTKKFSLGLDGEFRSRNDFRTADRWSIGLDAGYKLKRWLKLSAGYVFIDDNRTEKISFNTDGSYNNWRPSYWTTRHRLYAGFTLEAPLGRFNFSLRERWQYTYRPSATTDRYDFDNSKWEDTDVRSKAANVLRSRLQVEYDIPNCKVTPYANAEINNAWSIEKVRYTVGANWKITKQHSVGLYYRLQHTSASADEEKANLHIVGAGYKFKF